MFEFLKDYESFRNQIREVKVETFKELQDLLNENQKLKQDKQNLMAQHEREVMTLAHALQLDRERFALEKEQLIAKTKGDLFGERERFLEKNFTDLKDSLKIQHEATKDVLSLVVQRLPDMRVRMGGDLEPDSRRALPAADRSDEPPAE